MKYIKIFEYFTQDKYELKLKYSDSDEQEYYFIFNNIKVGYVFIKHYFDDELYLSSLTIEDKYQNKGMGTIFLIKILELMKNNYNEKLIRLAVSYDNKIAINIYKKIGFIEDRPVDKYQFYMIKPNS